MTNKEQGLQKVKELVIRFNEQLQSYKKADYNETQTRRDFIDPLFKALGWDIDNSQGNSEKYREVIHEDKIKIKGKTKAPDYSFRLSGGNRLFFVEAKKPSIHIKDDIQPAYQLRRYGWSGKLSVSIITDFEEFAIYDCTKKPNAKDKASAARLNYITYNQYEQEWDFIWNTFSKEGVQKGNFDKYIGSAISKKGSEPVDTAFLTSLDEWRTLLAESISKDNKHITEDELNFVVQHTLDRIIFLRITEDRSIEPQGALQHCVTQGDYFKNALKLFKQADNKYNSGLFDFKKDKISATLHLNNKTLKTIVDDLYYPASPYEFSQISVEILGSAYEQFLGKTITINNRGKAIIELKPEVRKAGGVYYTPQYIVDYIVESTIGKLIKNKTPKEVAELKIVDPACGSGSFLLGAYQYLLTWHLDYYLQNPSKKNPITVTGNLDTNIKKQILLNNIYGVDIDVNAVEVTKLSLLLKCLEHETNASIAHQVTMFNERVLPTLDNNIKSGNSLIDTDYYDNQIDFGEERKIKPFNWQKAFPEVFKPRNESGHVFSPDPAIYYNEDDTNVSEPMLAYKRTVKGGFDVVIGNPPYVDYRLLSVSQQEYLKQKYNSTQTKEKYSLYIPFIELGTVLLNKNGYLGVIVPNTFLSANMGLPLRKHLIANTSITEITDVSKLKVFGNVGTYPVLVFYKNTHSVKNNINIAYPETKEHFFDLKFSQIKQIDIKKEDDYILSSSFDKNSVSFLSKLDNSCVPLSSLTQKFVWGTSITGFKSFKIQSNDYNKLSKTNKLNYQKVIQTADIKSYGITWKKEYISKEIYSSNIQEIFNVKEKIVIARLTKTIQATLDDEQYYLGKSSLIITNKINNLYLVGLLNSKLLNFYFKTKFDNTHMAGGYMRFDIPYLSKLPIKSIDKKNKVQTQAHDQIVSYVTQLLQLNKNLQIVTLATQTEQLKTKIDYCEGKINELVYVLYELTDEEIKLIEN